MLKKTKEEKEMQGTYEPSKDLTEALKFEDVETAYAPQGLPLYAQKIWRERAAGLKKAGYMAREFYQHLEAFCWATYEASTARKKLMDLGEEKMFTSEANSAKDQLREANKAILQFGAKFGFSPYDAAKIPKITNDHGKVMSLIK